MKNRPAYKEPLSTLLRKRSQDDKEEIAKTIRWVGLAALGIFLALIVSSLLSDDYTRALIISIGLIPIVISLILIQQNTISAPSTLLAITIIFLITWLATRSQGIYDIGVLGFPVILIVEGLILRGRVIMYLVLLIIACMAWLVFGAILNIYEPIYLSQTQAEDFFIGAIVILIAGNAVFRLTRNVYKNLSRAEDQIRMREEVEKDREVVILQLKRKNQELDRFAIRVSHDLKTPLITLAGFLGYLEKDINEGNYERAHKDFLQINNAAKKMGKLVDELLDLSRVGRIINPPTDVPFDEIVQDALTATDGLLRAKQVQVEIDAVFPVVHVDRVRIVQVLQNLLANAVKFMGDQPNPKIKIGCRKTEGENVFFVSDNGIAAQDHEQIFELFVKLNPELEGTGLGLGLVKKIIEVHNGRIWVESELGKGATFFFTLENKI